MRKITAGGIGILLIFVSLYIFPFGMELLYWIALSIYGGDFWRATVFLYALSILLLMVGIALATHRISLGPFNFIKSKIFILLVIVVTIGTMFVMLPANTYLPS